MNYIVTIQGDIKKTESEIKNLAETEDLEIKVVPDSTEINYDFKNYAIVIDDDVPLIVQVLKYFNGNKYIQNVICFDNRSSYYQYSKFLNETPLIIIMDFKIYSEATSIFDDTSELYLKFKEQFINCPVLGYTNYEDSGNPDTNSDTKKLIDLLNKKGDSVFDKMNINTIESFNNIVRDKIRISLIQKELEKVKKESEIIKQKLISIDKIELEAYLNNPIEPVLYNIINETSYPLIGISNKIKEIRFYISKVSKFNNPIFIAGETGTGKENVARAIHRFQNKNPDSFQAINCGTLQNDLFESELFGYEPGAHSTALKAKKGLIELANKGTLFLDEIGDISLHHQVKLLRVVEDKVITRLGGTKQIKVDFRIISATNKPIQELIQNSSIREDFAERLGMLNPDIPKLPSLKERKEDIPYLIKHFTKGKNINFTDGAIEYLTNLEWNTNIRQLKNSLPKFELFNKDGYSFNEEDVKSILKIKESEPLVNGDLNLEAKAILQQVLEIVQNLAMISDKTKFTIEEVGNLFTGKSGEKIKAKVFEQDYWKDNKSLIAELIRKDKVKYKILLEKCQFIHNAVNKVD